MKGLDLSKFKKVASDKTCTTFKHENGSELKVAHSSLSPEMRKQLEALPIHKADGGGAFSKSQNQTLSGRAAEPTYNKGGKVKARRMADGGDATPDPQPNASPNAPLDVEPVDPNDPQNQATPPGVNININAGQPSQGQNPSQVAMSAPPSANPNDPNATASDGNSPVQVNPTQMPTQKVPLPPAQTPPPVPTAAQVITQPGSADAALAHLNDETSKLRQDYNNGQITPETYQQLFAKKDTLGKIGTIFGLMAGGIGGGMTHQQNALLGMMDKEIDRDLDAQKQTKTNQFNALNLAEAHYRDEVQAHYTQQQGAATEANTALTQANTSLMQTNTAKAAMELAVEREALRRAGQLPANTPAGQRARLAASSLSDAITTQQASRNQATAQQIAANGQQAQQQYQAPQSYILAPNAQQIYQGLQWDPTKTAQQKADIQNQYNSAIQTEKALGEIDKLYPELASKATWSGYWGDKVSPRELAAAGAGLGGVTGAGLAVLGSTLLPPAVAGVPAAAAAGATAGGALGETAGLGLQGAANLVGGQQEIQYQTAKASLMGYIGSALAGANVTPSEIAELADKFAPTKRDSPETVQDKLNKLKEKIVNLTKTSALDSAGMTKKGS